MEIHTLTTKKWTEEGLVQEKFFFSRRRRGITIWSLEKCDYLVFEEKKVSQHEVAERFAHRLTKQFRFADKILEAMDVNEYMVKGFTGSTSVRARLILKKPKKYEEYWIGVGGTPGGREVSIGTWDIFHARYDFKKGIKIYAHPEERYTDTTAEDEEAHRLLTKRGNTVLSFKKRPVEPKWNAEQARIIKEYRQRYKWFEYTELPDGDLTHKQIITALVEEQIVCVLMQSPIMKEFFNLKSLKSADEERTKAPTV